MNYTVELKNVTKVFDELTVLDNINLKIANGDVLALLGPNGSGKTTLLKILAFLEKPSKGEVYFFNEKITGKKMEQMRKESTMVFQKTALFNTTVYNNVAYGLKIRKMPKRKIEEEVNKALRKVMLEGFEKRHAKELSGGEQQRVALARALALNTKLLLLDEPTANLDPRNASIVEEVIMMVNRELKTTIVIATHNMFQAKQLPNHVALVIDGKISDVGTSSKIFGSLSKTIASFAALENTFRGKARFNGNGTTFIDIGNNVLIEAAAQSGGEVSIFISPEDIILSRNSFQSSARNVFKGKIIEILDLGSLVALKVDVGKPFTVQITKRSFNEMGLNLNKKVYITFKASSIKII